jgi:hypothetical protein
MTDSSALAPAAVDWPAMIWSQARQVTALLGWPAMPGDEAVPSRFFAAQFLGLSLPRYEAVAWAARVLGDRRLSRGAEGATMGAVLAWLREPTDAARRAAATAAESIDDPSPAKLCATAVFLSGGSITPPDQEPIPAARHGTGLLTAGAILIASYASDDPAAFLAAALDAGAGIAAQPRDLAP